MSECWCFLELFCLVLYHDWNSVSELCSKFEKSWLIWTVGKSLSVHRWICSTLKWKRFKWNRTTCSACRTVLVSLKITWCFKAMLHEAISLATCNATMTNKKPFKFQRGSYTFATFFATCNACNNKQDGGNLPRVKDELWLGILTKLRCKLLRGCYTQATCLATLRKVECRSTFLATRNATIAVAKWGVTLEFFLATCNATFVALQVARKIASRDMALL